jgi:hypothetical protein
VGPENPKPGIDGATMWKASDRVAAVSGRVGERPAVGDDQWQRRGLRGANVQEVHVLAVDGGRELGVLVELRFVLAPVIAIAPVARETFR